MEALFDSPIAMMGWGLLARLARLIIILLVINWILRLLDERCGIDFSDWWDNANANIKGVYLCVRLMLVGLIMVGVMG